MHPISTLCWQTSFCDPWVPSPPSKPPQLDPYCCESSWVRLLSHFEWVSRFISVVCWSAPRCWLTFHFRTRLQLCIRDLLMAVWTVSSLELLWARLLLILIFEYFCRNVHFSWVSESRLSSPQGRCVLIFLRNHSVFFVCPLSGYTNLHPPLAMYKFG